LIVTIGAAAGPAQADAGAEATQRAACKRDAIALCPLQAIARDRAGVRDCLVRNVAKISDACRGVVKAAQSAAKTNE
jgi:hypothetical protein